MLGICTLKMTSSNRFDLRKSENKFSIWTCHAKMLHFYFHGDISYISWCFSWTTKSQSLKKGSFRIPLVPAVPIRTADRWFIWMKSSPVLLWSINLVKWDSNDLFGMVKWPFQGVKWPPTRGWKGHFESPGRCVSPKLIYEKSTKLAPMLAVNRNCWDTQFLPLKFAGSSDSWW